MKEEKKYYYLAALFLLFFLFSAVPQFVFGWSDPYVTSSTVTESYTYTVPVWIDCKWIHYTTLYRCRRCPGSGSSCRPYCTYNPTKALVLNPAGVRNPTGVQYCESSQCNGDHSKYADVYQNSCDGSTWCDNGSRPPTLDHWEYETRTGYRDVTTYTCHYISAVTAWTCNSSGQQIAAAVAWSSTPGTSCSNVPLVREGGCPRLTVNVDGGGNVNGGGINCSSGSSGTCAVIVNAGSVVNLDATANADSRNDSWQGGGGSCSGPMNPNGLCTTGPINADTTITANFILKPNLQVLINGCGTITAPGWSCTSSGGSKTCPSLRAYNTNVTLSTIACPDSHFGSWGGACSGSSGCSVNMGTTDQSVIAYFASQSNCSCDTNDCKSTCIGQACDDSCGNPTCKGTLSCPLWQEVQP